MISIGMIVTRRLSAKTHCHHNLGYEPRKHMIRCTVMRSAIGPRYALEVKLVHI